jgi:uncharacterized protein (TIGR00251 family)
VSVTAVPGGVRIQLHVQPGASTSEVVGLHGDRIRLRIQSPPIDGRANEAVLQWIAERLGVPRRAVTLVRGEKSRAKTVDVRGVTVSAAEAALQPRPSRRGDLGNS